MTIVDQPESKFSVPLPQKPILRAAGIWIGMNFAFALQDIAGLSYSKTVPYSYRAPVFFLSLIGAVFVVWILLALGERWVKSISGRYQLLAKRICIAIVVVLCVAAPIVLGNIPIELAAPYAFNCVR